jgi:dTDP-4-dehydrorhamnose reductase
VNARAQRRVLVSGAAGMLGSQLLLSAPQGVRAIGTDLAAGVEEPGVDLSDEAAVEGLLGRCGELSGILHTAAYTAVDRAEAEPELAERVNVAACAVLARAAARRSVDLVVVSTDFVFDGRARAPYGVEALPAPLSVYGRTKLAGERAALAAHPHGTAIVRTQWLYGPRGKHFPRTIVALARERGALRVVDDQVGSPTTTLELAPALWDLWRLGGRGVFHAACEGECSWHGFTAAILAELGLDGVRLEACSTAEFPRPAARPAYSVLDSSRLARLRGAPLLPWRAALCDYLESEPL